MRLAVLADIHGNLAALEAVLEDLQTQGVDEIVVAGDTVNVLPDSKMCWDRVVSLGCPLLRGNHERYVYDYGTPEASPDWATERFKLLAWMQRQFAVQDLEVMRSLPLTHRLPKLLITHATPRNEFESVFETTPPHVLREMFGSTTEPFILRGHNHVWREHRWDGRVLVTIASVGLPMNGIRDAQYALLTQTREGWQLEPQYVPYDVEMTLKRMDTPGYSEASGPMAHLFRQELTTAETHLIPFLQTYLTAVDQGELTLKEAVAKYLA